MENDTKRSMAQPEAQVIDKERIRANFRKRRSTMVAIMASKVPKLENDEYAAERLDERPVIKPAPTCMLLVGDRLKLRPMGPLRIAVPPQRVSLGSNILHGSPTQSFGPDMRRDWILMTAHSRVRISDQTKPACRCQEIIRNTAKRRLRRP